MFSQVPSSFFFDRPARTLMFATDLPLTELKRTSFAIRPSILMLASAILCFSFVRPFLGIKKDSNRNGRSQGLTGCVKGLDRLRLECVEGDTVRVFVVFESSRSGRFDFTYVSERAEVYCFAAFGCCFLECFNCVAFEVCCFEVDGARDSLYYADCVF